VLTILTHELKNRVKQCGLTLLLQLNDICNSLEDNMFPFFHCLSPSPYPVVVVPKSFSRFIFDSKTYFNNGIEVF